MLQFWEQKVLEEYPQPLRRMAIGSPTCRGFCVSCHMIQLSWPTHTGPGSPSDLKTVICTPTALPSRRPAYQQVHPIFSTCFGYTLCPETLLFSPCMSQSWHPSRWPTQPHFLQLPYCHWRDLSWWCHYPWCLFSRTGKMYPLPHKIMSRE